MYRSFSTTHRMVGSLLVSSMRRAIFEGNSASIHLAGGATGLRGKLYPV
jgi:hypothetical protein